MKKEKQKFAFRIGMITLGLLAFIGFMFVACSPDLVLTGAQVVTCGALFLAGVNISDKSAAELKELRGQAQQKLIDLTEKAKTEKRSLTPEEIEIRNDLVKSIGDLKNEIGIKEVIEEEQRQGAHRKFKKDDDRKPEERELDKFSFIKLIRSGMERRALDGIELEMHQEAEKEARASGISLVGLGVPAMLIERIARRGMTATGQTTAAGDQGGHLIPSTIEGLVMALRPKLVLAGLGANTYGNMIGNITIVKGTSTSANWEGENDDLDETESATSTLTISPKRLGALTKLSKQWLIQTNNAFEQRIINDILAAIAQKVEAAAINGTGSNNLPTGILGTTGIGSVVGGTNGLAPTWEHITGLESKVDIANANDGSCAYLTNNKVKNKLKNTLVAEGMQSFIWPVNGTEVNGYKTVASNLVPSTLTKGTSNGVCSAIVFGDFKGLDIYNWGGMDITIDPYTSKKSGQLEISVDSFWDVAIQEPAKFAAMVDALTA